MADPNIPNWWKAGLFLATEKAKLDGYPVLTGDTSKYLNANGEFVTIQSGGGSFSTDVTVAGAHYATSAGSATSATSANKLSTARTITITGAITGSTTFDGSGNATIKTSNATISSGSTTSVKGNAESSYRTGQVNITAANIGLGNVDNTHDSVKAVASSAKLTTARKINLKGAVSGSTTFDGSGDVTITTSGDLSDSTAIHNGDENVKIGRNFSIGASATDGTIRAQYAQLLVPTLGSFSASDNVAVNIGRRTSIARDYNIGENLTTSGTITGSVAKFTGATISGTLCLPTVTSTQHGAIWLA